MFWIRILTAALVVFNGILMAYSLYGIFMAFCSIPKKLCRGIRTEPRKSGNLPMQNRFAILIAARNEASVIGNLVESLHRQQYPAHLFDIIVVPNNCTDQTRQVAVQAGARIMTCRQMVRSKGDVLNQMLPEISKPEKSYDAICVVDADNLVHPGFLTAMNQALLDGAVVAQGYRDIKNPHDTAITGSYSIHFWLINRFFNKARHNIGLSTPIGGSGYMIRTSLIRKMAGFRFVTLTEDIELTILCHLADEKVVWVPRAIVYDEQPLTFRQSWKQRSRWSSGMFQISSLYTRPILKKAWHDRRIHGLDLILLFLPAHMQVLLFFVMVIRSLIGLLQLFNHQLTPAVAWSQSLSSIAQTCLIVTGLAFLTALLDKRLERGIWRGICFYWIFIFSWMPINLYCLFHRTTSWEQIRHERSIRLQDLSTQD